VKYNLVLESSKYGFLFIAILLIIATLIVYMPAMRAGFIWDDDAYVTENPLLSAPDGLKRIWFSFDQPSQYFPLTYTVFRLEYRLWGIDSFGYHIINIILHIANVFLIWWVLIRLRVPGAWIAAFIFALHPINVESVAWVTELKNVMMTFFSLLCILAWFRVATNNAESDAKDYLWYAISLVLYTFALFSKTTACTLPIAMVLILWFKHIPVRKRQWRLIVPYIFLGIMMGLVTLWWEQIRGSSGTVLKLNFIERILLAGKALWFYLGKLILPINLTFSYPLWDIDWTNPSHYIWILAVAGAAILIWCYRVKIGRGPIAGIIFFVVTLAPVLGFVSIYTFYYSYVADHYVYVACIGPIAVLASAFAILWRKTNGVIRHVLSGSLVIILVMLGVFTWRQGHIYKDLQTLWQDTLKKNPDSLLAHSNMGLLEYNRGNIEQALLHYHRALQIYPDDEVVYYNLGTILKSQGNIDQAVTCFRKAVQIRPSYVAAQNNLAVTLKMQGKIDEALEHYHIALSFQPNNAMTHYNLGNALRSLGMLDKALIHYKQAIRLDPRFNDARINLAVTLELSGRVDDAINQYREVLEFDSNSIIPLSALAELFIRNPDPNIQNVKESVRYAERAAELTNYSDPTILGVLGRAYAVNGDRKKALVTEYRALDLATAAGDDALAELIRRQIQLHEKSN
jgi:tetratricopeptide (TPR) repeat protein